MGNEKHIGRTWPLPTDDMFQSTQSVSSKPLSGNCRHHKYLSNKTYAQNKLISLASENLKKLFSSWFILCFDHRSNSRVWGGSRVLRFVFLGKIGP